MRLKSQYEGWLRTARLHCGMDGKNRPSSFVKKMLRPQFHLPDDHIMDFHFRIAQIEWMRNKEEIFTEPGTGGSFEYSSGVKMNNLSFHDNPDISQIFRVAETLNVQSFLLAASHIHLSVRVGLVRGIHGVKQDRKTLKMRKELASISEQTNIPIYLDGLKRPPRKCRI